MTANDIYEVLADIIANKSDLRGVIAYHGDKEGQTTLLDFSNCGDPYPDDTVCTWCKSVDIIDEEGHYSGSDELGYGHFTTYGAAIHFTLQELENTPHDFHSESF